MDLELKQLFKTLGRWGWLILSIVVVTGIALGLGLYFTEPTYRAKVKLQFTTPEQENISLYDQFRYVSERDEVAIARNNFLEVLTSSEVRSGTIEQLGLVGEDKEYDIEADIVRDADFINVIVTAGTPELAADIANTHTAITIDRSGELRALPASAVKDQLEEQLQSAEQELYSAEETLAEFQAENNVANLESELATSRRVLEQLELKRSEQISEASAQPIELAAVEQLLEQRQSELQHLLAQQPIYNNLVEAVQQTQQSYQLVASQYNGAEAEAVADEQLVTAKEELEAAEAALAEFQAQNGLASLELHITMYQNMIEQLHVQRDRLLLLDSSNVASGNTNLDSLIDQQQAEVARLAALEPKYNLLKLKAEQVHEKYQLILNKYSESELKVDAVQMATYIQIIRTARPPSVSASSDKQTLILGLLGSLCFGILLAFLLEYVTSARTEEAEPSGTSSKLPPITEPATVPRLSRSQLTSTKLFKKRT